MTKLTLLLILVACLQAYSNGYAQGNITLSKKQAPLQQIFKEIKRQTGYLFVYRNEWLAKAHPVNIHVSNMPLEDVLKICLQDQPLTYVVIDKTIVLKPKEEKPVQTTNNALQVVPIDVRGRVVDENGKPLEGISVTVKGTSIGVSTNSNGEFELRNIDGNSILLVSGVNIDPYEMSIKGRNELVINVKNKILEIEAVNVVNTGYQTFQPERTTGSYQKIDNQLINRSVSLNIIDRLKGIASGVLFNSGTSDLGFNIRGRSTIFGNTAPLIVVDNFPYDGDLNTINPNDVESITILKDAASASIWGVRAGNGVVVITTFKGKYNQPLRVSFNSNITVGEKPNLYSRPDMSPSEIIDIETFLFDKGVYNNDINNRFPGLSPVVEILLKKRNGTISADQAVSQINDLRDLNNKEDLLQYYYRKSVSQQYSVNLKGGGFNNKYYFSLGYDKNLEEIKTNSSNRVTLNTAYTYSLPAKGLELSTNIVYSSGSDESNGRNDFFINRPYVMLADADGSPLTFYQYRKAWLDTIGGGRLLDWTLKPLEEVRRKDFKSTLTNYFLNTGLKYRFLKGLELNLLYQYSKGITESRYLLPGDSYHMRNLVNQFSQINYATGTVTRPVPLGDMLQMINGSYFSHNFRSQLNYNHSWSNRKHVISALGGFELKNYNVEQNTNTLYGYNKDLGIIANVDFANQYPLIYNPNSRSVITGTPTQLGTSDRFISFFFNAAYTLNEKYTLSASARKDESNLFGVEANQKGVPLWSIGGSWNISKETFYNITWLPDLRLRITNGYNGNVDKSVSAFTTARISTINVFNMPTMVLVNPPNPLLRWEKINMTNIGLDFTLINDRISGAFEYYFKNGKDIIGNSPLPPQAGVTQFRGNSADIKGKGIDIVLNSRNIKKLFEWNTSFLFSYNTDKISKYLVKTAPTEFHEGYPYSAIFSYKWAGLDPATGDPRGYLNGQVSKTWATIVNTDSIGRTTTYNGAGIPTYFGSLRNTFKWHNLSLSCNILFKMGYYFRSRSVNYTSLLGGSLTGHKDYTNRWQKPGDEAWTNVPSMIYPAVSARENFYANSEILIEKGSHIRLQDLQMNYDLPKGITDRLQLQSARIYFYANNLGLLWKANNKEIDPDNPEIKLQKTIAFGLSVTF